MAEITSITFHDAVVAEYRKAVARMAQDGGNRQDAFAYANEAIRQRIHVGEIDIPLDDAIHSALLAADAREGATADRVLQKIADGQIGIDVWPDPLLDVVVTLGGGRRKTWRHVTADDLRQMVELRQANTRAARRSERRFTKDVQAIYSGLIAAGTVGRMVEIARAEVA